MNLQDVPNVSSGIQFLHDRACELAFPAGLAKKVEIVGIVRTIPDQPYDFPPRTHLAFARHTKRSNANEPAVFPGGHYQWLAISSVSFPPGSYPFPAQEECVSSARAQQQVPPFADALDFPPLLVNGNLHAAAFSAADST